MAMAGSLLAASALTYSQMQIKALAAATYTVKNALGTFLIAIDPLFPDSLQFNRILGNWIIPLSNVQVNMHTSPMTPAEFNAAVDGVSKLCLAAAAGGTDPAGNAFFTNAQLVALLAAWNTAFGT